MVVSIYFCFYVGFFLSNNPNVFSREKRQQSSSSHRHARWGVCRACKLLRAWAWREAIKSVFSLCHILPDLPLHTNTSKHKTTNTSKHKTTNKSKACSLCATSCLTSPYIQTHQSTKPQTRKNTKTQTHQKRVLFVPHADLPPTFVQVDFWHTNTKQMIHHNDGLACWW